MYRMKQFKKTAYDITILQNICNHSPNDTVSHPIRLNPLKAELNPIRHLLALLGAHHILNISRIRVKSLTLHYAC